MGQRLSTSVIFLTEVDNHAPKETLVLETLEDLRTRTMAGTLISKEEGGKKEEFQTKSQAKPLGEEVPGKDPAPS